jgi:hypothetical protein
MKHPRETSSLGFSGLPRGITGLGNPIDSSSDDMQLVAILLSQQRVKLHDPNM